MVGYTDNPEPDYNTPTREELQKEEAAENEAAYLYTQATAACALSMKAAGDLIHSRGADGWEVAERFLNEMAKLRMGYASDEKTGDAMICLYESIIRNLVEEK